MDDRAFRDRTVAMLRDNFDAWGPAAGPTPRAMPAGPTIERLEQLRIPTLVVIGEADVPGLQEVASLLVCRVPGAMKVVLPQAGHHPHLQWPAAFDNIVRGFLQD